MARRKKTDEQRAAEAMARETRAASSAAKIRDGIFKQFVRRRLLFVAALIELASAAAVEGEIGFDGKAPEITGGPGPGENPQMRPVRNVREHPLDLMWHKGQISAAQFSAGEILRRDIEMSLISPMTGRRYESIYTVELTNKAALKDAGLSEMLGPKTFAAKGAKASFTWTDLKDVTLDAMDRANKARAAIASREGQQAAEITFMMLRDGFTVNEIAASRDAGGAPRFGHRNGVGRKLQRGLEALALHYGINRRRTRVHPWHSDAEDTGRGVDAPIEPAAEKVRV